MSLSRESDRRTVRNNPARGRSDIKAAGLLKIVFNEKFVGTLLIKVEVIPSVDKLSKALQTKSLQVDLLEGMIKLTIETLEAQKNLQTKVQNFCITNVIPLTVSQEPEVWLQATRRIFIDKLVETIKERFDDQPVLVKISILFARGDYQER